MQPKLIKLYNAAKESFSINLYSHKRFPGIWHYHYEYEITYIIKSSGTRFVGDHIEQFFAGELIVIGHNLPHTWANDHSRHKEAKDASQALVIHFRKDCFNEHFWDLPELEPVKKLLDRAKFGLKIGPSIRKPVADLMQKMLMQEKTEKLISFLSILHLLARDRKAKALASRGFMNSLENTYSDRINRVYRYIMENFKSELSLIDVAKVANMSPSAFSRFFSSCTRKSFSQFVIEIKIGYSCKLLSQAEQSVTQICYQCGFNNISNFNKQFKKITNTTPKKYQQTFSKTN